MHVKGKFRVLRKLARIEKELREVQRFCQENKIAEVSILNSVVWLRKTIEKLDGSE